ncbi:2Fe-2S iron-sulfur cluster-binding protein [Rhodanobacter aciditrophus]|uniref:2Fe-2S iron-sulfur cluster-binding protein n=1 Tax=Rhodanobacter aciditrophus TaxID=1623218 RepID=A0ABW4B1A9_9GAMM
MSEIYTVTLDGSSYLLPAGSNLLQGLLGKGAIVPHSCLAGACESCALFDLHSQEKRLTCQTSVDQNLALTRYGQNAFPIATRITDVTVEADDFAIVTCHANTALLPCDAINWRIGDETGMSVSLTSSDEAVRLLLPIRLEADFGTLELGKKQQRTHIDPALKSVIICEGHLVPLGDELIKSLMALSHRVYGQPLVTDFEGAIPDQVFQRYDVAYVLIDRSVSMESLEKVFSLSKMRVEQYQYLLLTK